MQHFCKNIFWRKILENTYFFRIWKKSMARRWVPAGIFYLTIFRPDRFHLWTLLYLLWLDFHGGLPLFYYSVMNPLLRNTEKMFKYKRYHQTGIHALCNGVYGGMFCSFDAPLPSAFNYCVFFLGSKLTNGKLVGIEIEPFLETSKSRDSVEPCHYEPKKRCCMGVKIIKFHITTAKRT